MPKGKPKRRIVAMTDLFGGTAACRPADVRRIVLPLDRATARDLNKRAQAADMPLAPFLARLVAYALAVRPAEADELPALPGSVKRPAVDEQRQNGEADHPLAEAPVP